MPPVTLTPQRDVSRPLSAFEYFHASVGTSPRTLGGAREIFYVVEGAGSLPLPRLQAALDNVVAANPACRLRIVGTRRGARFESTGAAMPLRHVDGTGWNGSSHTGADCLRGTPLSLADGPLSELLLIESPPGDSPRTRVAVRAHHAAMDGLGMAHVMHELFRALRGEALVGSNAPFSDTDLMRSLGVNHSDSRPLKCARLTGAAHGDDPAIWWRRVSVEGKCPNSLLKLVGVFADLAREHDPDLPCLFSLPINLRRHLDGIHSAQNFGNMLLVPLAPNETPRDFKRRLNAMLAGKMEARFAPAFDRIRWLPMPWLDWLTQRRRSNYRTKRTLETCMISHLGYTKTAELSCAEFVADGVYAIPGACGVFCTVTACDKRLDAIVGMPAVYGDAGRFERVVERLTVALNA